MNVKDNKTNFDIFMYFFVFYSNSFVGCIIIIRATRTSFEWILMRTERGGLIRVKLWRYIKLCMHNGWQGPHAHLSCAARGRHLLFLSIAQKHRKLISVFGFRFWVINRHMWDRPSERVFGKKRRMERGTWDLELFTLIVQSQKRSACKMLRPPGLLVLAFPPHK